MRKGRRFGKQFWIAGLTWMMIAGLTGCGATSDSTAFGTADKEFMAESSTVEYEMTESESGVLSNRSETPQVRETARKLIKTVDMTVETKEFDAMVTGLNEQISACGGYVESMNTYNGSIYSSWQSLKSASMTVRIPEEKLDEFLDTVTGISNVVRRSDRVEDVTLVYVDLESHKAALQTEQTRLLELLEKAETVEDIITIEERLSDVRYQIERMESQLRTYDNKISYSTVNLEIEEVQELTPVKEETVWERISDGFADSLQRIGDGFVEFGIWLIVNSPFLIIWAVVIMAVILILRKWKRRHVRKQQSAFQGIKKEEITRENKKNE